ncbi:MAG: outer membrane protein assembly factor BamD, partial [Terriglobales bacterium]
GASNLAQAEAQYRDFITFFPNMPEAREAQLRIATIHFRQIQKPDRDPTQALDAQRDLKAFLRAYPTGLMSKQALQMLRETDEVLAEGIFRVGQYYAVTGNYRAEQDRLRQVLKNYPLFSHGDEAMAMLARSYLITSSRYSWAQGNTPKGIYHTLFKQNAIGDFRQAQIYLTRLIERYPLSPEVPWAKRALAYYHKPVPTPTPEAIAFNRAEIAGRGELDRWDRWTGMLHGRPLKQLAWADKVGNPLLQNPSSAGNENAEIAALAGKPQQATPSGGTTGPLAFQSVPTGGFVDPNNVSTPTATTANDYSGAQGQDVVNGQVAGADPPDKDLTTLTPNQLDALQAKQMLAAEIHRDVPVPRKLAHRLLAPTEVLHPGIATKTVQKLQSGQKPATTPSTAPAAASPSNPPTGGSGSSPGPGV